MQQSATEVVFVRKNKVEMRFVYPQIAPFHFTRLEIGMSCQIEEHPNGGL
jgi:hypothetical protein